MSLSDIISEYLSANVTKSGLLMVGGKCLYLYGELCCEAECSFITINENSFSSSGEFINDLFIMKTGTKITLYKNYRRVLQLKELISIYRIPLPDGEINGIFTGGQEVFNTEMQFTDRRIADLVKYLITGNRRNRVAVRGEFQKLEQAIASGEVKELSQVNKTGHSLKDELNSTI